MSSSTQSSWTYVEIYIYDGDRVLRPTHLCGTEVTFNTAPELVSDTIRIVTKNGDQLISSIARVLKHERTERRIPIELIGKAAVTHEPPVDPSVENASTKLLA